MLTDRQFRRLRSLLQTESTLANAADRVNVDEKTARKYRDSDLLPSQRRVLHAWRTREDPFQDVWPELQDQLRLNPGLQAKTCAPGPKMTSAPASTTARANRRKVGAGRWIMFGPQWNETTTRSVPAARARAIPSGTGPSDGSSVAIGM
jgi:hypothetical protein